MTDYDQMAEDGVMLIARAIFRAQKAGQLDRASDIASAAGSTIRSMWLDIEGLRNKRTARR